MKISKKVVEKPWGHEEIIVHTPKYVMKKIFIKAGCRLSKQFHNEKDETVYVHKGVLYLDLSMNEGESNVVKVVEGEAWRIVPPTIHRFCAPDEQDVVLFEISTPQLEDVFRLQDDYGRARGKIKTKI